MSRKIRRIQAITQTPLGLGYKYTPVTEFSRPSTQTYLVEGITTLPKVVISATAHGKMLALVKACTIEVGWLSSVSVTPEGDLSIDDVYVPLQNCSGGSTDITEDGEAELLMELLGSEDTSVINRLKCWGHSHVNMAVFPSGTDEHQTNVFAGKFNGHFVRFIANKRGDLLCHVYLISDQLILHNPPMVIIKDDVDYTAWADNEVATKVSHKIVKPHGSIYKPNETYGWPWDEEEYARELAHFGWTL